jgi:type II secretory pathway predicted ATPase ExeA
MDIAQTGLRRQPFHVSGQPVIFVPYHAQLSAHHFLQMILKDDRGIGVFYGPESSGKKCIVHDFLRGIFADIPVAVIDAERLKTRDLLTALLAQYDPGPTFETVDDCWYALRVFLAEKTRNGQTPLVVLENFNKMYPSGLYALNKLAELQVQGQYDSN